MTITASLSVNFLPPSRSSFLLFPYLTRLNRCWRKGDVQRGRIGGGRVKGQKGRKPNQRKKSNIYITEKPTLSHLPRLSSDGKKNGKIVILVSDNLVFSHLRSSSSFPLPFFLYTRSYCLSNEKETHLLNLVFSIVMSVPFLDPCLNFHTQHFLLLFFLFFNLWISFLFLLESFLLNVLWPKASILP